MKINQLEKKQRIIKGFCKVGELILDAKAKYELKELKEEDIKRLENRFGKEVVRRATVGGSKVV